MRAVILVMCKPVIVSEKFVSTCLENGFDANLGVQDVVPVDVIHIIP